VVVEQGLGFMIHGEGRSAHRACSGDTPPCKVTPVILHGAVSPEMPRGGWSTGDTRSGVSTAGGCCPAYHVGLRVAAHLGFCEAVCEADGALSLGSHLALDDFCRFPVDFQFSQVIFGLRPPYKGCDPLIK